MEKKISQLTASVTKILDSLRQIMGSSTLSRTQNLGDVLEEEGSLTEEMFCCMASTLDGRVVGNSHCDTMVLWLT